MVGELGRKQEAKNASQRSPVSTVNQTRENDLTPDWAAVERDYRDGILSVRQICLAHAVSSNALSKTKNRLGWPGRYAKRQVNRKQLISRLFAVLEKQIEKLENQIMDDENSDKEVALLGTLCRTLEKLVELDTKKALPNTRSKKTGPDLTSVRNKIAKRMRQLEKS